MKRAFDFIAVLLAAPLWVPLAAAVALAVLVLEGRPVFFVQERAGLHGRPFRIVKFRTMRGGEGADSERLGRFGRFLRASSLDELPELFLVLVGTMSLVGPRPLPTRYLPRYSPEQMRRHNAMPGVTGWAQVHGRNDIDWEKKLDYDLQYLEKITFWGDLKLIFQTVFKVLKREGITEVGSASGEDYGDYLLNRGKVSPEDYEAKQAEAREILGQRSSIGSKQ